MKYKSLIRSDYVEKSYSTTDFKTISLCVDADEEFTDVLLTKNSDGQLKLRIDTTIDVGRELFKELASIYHTDRLPTLIEPTPHCGGELSITEALEELEKSISN